MPLIEKDISHEQWREYEWDEVRCDADGVLHRTGERIVYRIDNPKALFIRPGGTTHRVVDATGIAHCVPAVGLLGCVIRWYNGEGKEPVKF